MDILLWRDHFARPEALQLHDDLSRISFSCILEDVSRFAIQGLRRHTDWGLAHNRHYITHTLDYRGSASYCSRSKSITLPFSPGTLALWMPDTSVAIKNRIDSHCYCQQRRCDAEIHLAIQVLRRALIHIHDGFSHERKPPTPWLQGQNLVILSLVLDEYHEDANCFSCHFNPMEHQKLLWAGDLLLVDLVQAPGVVELTRESGLSVFKTKRSPRILFNSSVYGLFQAERVQKARRRLVNGNTSVMIVAADLGYANAGHFSAAPQKQSGVTPSTSKCGM